MLPWFFIEINSSLESAVTRDGVLGFFIIRFSFKKLYAAAESAFISLHNIQSILNLSLPKVAGRSIFGCEYGLLFENIGLIYLLLLLTYLAKLYLFIGIVEELYSSSSRLHGTVNFQQFLIYNVLKLPVTLQIATLIGRFCREHCDTM